MPAKPKTQTDLEYQRLCAADKKRWRELKSILPAEWSDCYAPQLARLCLLMAEESQLVRDIKRTSDGCTGMMYGQKGELRRHPLSTQLNSVRANISALCSDFGLDPKSNRKFSKGEGKDDPDALAGLMGGR